MQSYENVSSRVILKWGIQGCGSDFVLEKIRISVSFFHDAVVESRRRMRSRHCCYEIQVACSVNIRCCYKIYTLESETARWTGAKGCLCLCHHPWLYDYVSLSRCRGPCSSTRNSGLGLRESTSVYRTRLPTFLQVNYRYGCRMKRTMNRFFFVLLPSLFALRTWCLIFFFHRVSCGVGRNWWMRCQREALSVYVSFTSATSICVPGSERESRFTLHRFHPAQGLYRMYPFPFGLPWIRQVFVVPIPIFC